MLHGWASIDIQSYLEVLIKPNHWVELTAISLRFIAATHPYRYGIEKSNKFMPKIYVYCGIVIIFFIVMSMKRFTSMANIKEKSLRQN